jgi:uncharacterized Zn-finger protein
MKLKQSKNCLNQKFTEVENIDTILEIKDENQSGMNTEEAQIKQYPVDIAGLTAVNKQPSQTVTRIKEEDIQPSEIHIGNILENNNENKKVAGYELRLFKKIVTDDRAIRKENKNIECKICSKTITTNRGLRWHVDAVHKKMKPHQCQICAGTFSRMSSLKCHVDVVHNQLRPFECKICCKRLATNSDLNRHYGKLHKNLKS